MRAITGEGGGWLKSASGLGLDAATLKCDPPSRNLSSRVCDRVTGIRRLQQHHATLRTCDLFVRRGCRDHARHVEADCMLFSKKFTMPCYRCLLLFCDFEDKPCTVRTDICHSRASQPFDFLIAIRACIERDVQSVEPRLLLSVTSWVGLLPSCHQKKLPSVSKIKAS